MIRVLIPLFPLIALAGGLAKTETRGKAESTTTSAKTPLITSVRGAATVETGRDEGGKPAFAGTRLVERAELTTSVGGEIQLQLDPQRVLRLMEKTKVHIPGISWEGGEVPRITLVDGTMRWTSKEKGVHLQTPIFDVIPPAGDFVFAYDAKTGRADLWVIQGEIEFGAQNAETSVKVKSGEKANFQGVVEDGDVAADLLLQGRKIPRGKLSEVTALTADELKPFLNEEKIRQAETKAKDEKARKQKESDKKEGVICASPRGRFNECAWTCDGNPRESGGRCHLGSKGVSCVRRRCNANGAWAEAKTLDADEGKALCKATAVVGPCDY